MWTHIADLMAAGKPEAVRKELGLSGHTSTALHGEWAHWVSRRKEADVMAALPDVQRILLALYENENSLEQYATKWRKPIGERWGNQCAAYRESIKVLGLDQERALARRARYTKTVRERLADRVQLNASRIYEIIATCAKSHEFIDNIIAVMLATGSRLIEVIKVSQFEPVGAGRIRINGVAKSRDEKVLERPLIMLSAAQVIELVKYIRSFRDYAAMTPEQAKSKVIIALNNRVREFLDTTSHRARYIWTSLAWKLYGKGVPQQEWARAMLGHESADTSTTYLLYVVVVDRAPPRTVTTECDLPGAREYAVVKRGIHMSAEERAKRRKALIKKIGEEVVTSAIFSSYGHGHRA